MRRRIDAKTRMEMQEMRKTGATYDTIGTHFGFTGAAVYRAVNEFDGGVRRIRVNKEHYNALQRLAWGNRLSVEGYLALIIKDAIIDEAERAVQRSGTQGHSTSGEAREASGQGAL